MRHGDLAGARPKQCVERYDQQRQEKKLESLEPHFLCQHETLLKTASFSYSPQERITERAQLSLHRCLILNGSEFRNVRFLVSLRRYQEVKGFGFLGQSSGVLKIKTLGLELQFLGYCAGGFSGGICHLLLKLELCYWGTVGAWGRASGRSRLKHFELWRTSVPMDWGCFCVSCTILAVDFKPQIHADI